MIALDTNIIVYAMVQTQPEHDRALKWLQRQTDSLATTSTNIGETLRLLTHPKVFPKPVALKPAVSHLKKFVEAFGVMILDEPEDWWHTLPTLSKHPIAGNDVFDARIVCTLQFHGVKSLCTLDSGFDIYPTIEIVTP
jgi:predicted nucleic acid-binding protein